MQKIIIFFFKKTIVFFSDILYNKINVDFLERIMGDIFDLFKKIEKKSGNAPANISFIVACLGNPGREYALTRHNAGFLFAEYYAKEKGFRIDRARFDGLTGEYTVSGKRVLFLCPTTFMNLSGVSVKKAADFYKIAPENILVICDDINLDVGKLRLRRKGSDGGQKGVRSITEHLSTENFPRLKIGVGKKPHPEYDLCDWVLGRFPEDDIKKLKDVFDRCASALEQVMAGDFEGAMNKYN